MKLIEFLEFLKIRYIYIYIYIYIYFFIEKTYFCILLIYFIYKAKYNKYKI